MGLIWMQGYEWSNSVHLTSKPTFIENQFIIQTYWYISNLFPQIEKYLSFLREKCVSK